MSRKSHRLVCNQTRRGLGRMELILAFAGAICFAAILCGSFALMRSGYGVASSLPSARANRHPEAPMHGEAVLYVDLTRERLEQLYQQPS